MTLLLTFNFPKKDLYGVDNSGLEIERKFKSIPVSSTTSLNAASCKDSFKSIFPFGRSHLFFLNINNI